MTVSSSDFKAALSRWPSGVTVVTVPEGDGHRGTTVSAFSSVSLDPPLVLVAPSNDSGFLAVLSRGATVFAVNILAASQAHVSRLCAGADRSGLGQVAYTVGANGCALIDGALVQMECSVQSIVPAGDHHVVFGLVSRVLYSNDSPLVYWSRQYGVFAPQQP